MDAAPLARRTFSAGTSSNSISASTVTRHSSIWLKTTLSSCCITKRELDSTHTYTRTHSSRITPSHCHHTNSHSSCTRTHTHTVTQLASHLGIATTHTHIAHAHIARANTHSHTVGILTTFFSAATGLMRATAELPSQTRSRLCLHLRLRLATSLLQQSQRAAQGQRLVYTHLHLHVRICMHMHSHMRGQRHSASCVRVAYCLSVLVNAAQRAFANCLFRLHRWDRQHQCYQAAQSESELASVTVRERTTLMTQIQSQAKKVSSSPPKKPYS